MGGIHRLVRINGAMAGTHCVPKSRRLKARFNLSSVTSTLKKREMRKGDKRKVEKRRREMMRREEE